MSEKELTFEEAIEQLNEIVAKLEQEDVPLEKAIDYYQAGMKLSELCNAKLENAEEKMVQILNKNNEFENFDLEEE